jgi:Type II secretion system protein B
MAKMRLDTFVYTDVPADRMVTINGRKYIEGEQVDGLYRIESITREGVLLSYKDEKLVLRP